MLVGEEPRPKVYMPWEAYNTVFFFKSHVQSIKGCQTSGKMDRVAGPFRNAALVLKSILHEHDKTNEPLLTRAISLRKVFHLKLKKM